MITSSNLYKNA